MKLALVVAYDGSGFHGFARSDGVPSVQAALEESLGKVLRRPTDVEGAGRTDAGVHAWGQVVSFDAPDDTDAGRLQWAVNSMLGPQIVVRSAREVGADFHARFSAQWRSYRYTVLNRPVPDPFRVATSWWVPQPLSLSTLRLCCDPLIGEHDFSSFCRRPPDYPDGTPRTMARRIIDARWIDQGDDVVRFDIRAKSFCHQMVRSIVGTLVEVGLGKRRPGDLSGILRARDRSLTGQVAPAHGLCLWEVGY